MRCLLTVPELTMCSNYVLVQIKFFVSDCLSYNRSLLSIGLDHDLCLVTKFVYMR